MSGARGVSDAARVRLLYVVALALACACVVGGVLVVRERDARADGDGTSASGGEAVRDDTYDEVKAAADEVALAMVNIDYRDPQRSIDAVDAASTGTFAEEWGKGAEGLTEFVTRAKATLTSTVQSTAVSSYDADSATVLVATEGEVTNEASGEATQARYFRFLFTMARVDGEWRAAQLEIVG